MDGVLYDPGELTYCIMKGCLVVIGPGAAMSVS